MLVSFKTFATLQKYLFLMLLEIFIYFVFI